MRMSMFKGVKNYFGAAVAVIMLITANVWAQDANFPIGNGDGTADKPFQITTAVELAQLASLVNTAATSPTYRDKHYKLMNDLDIGGYANWTPIGNSSYPFQGVFDGNGKVISNLTINTTYNYLYGRGLFGYISGGTTKNLGLEYVNIVLNNDYYAGGIVGVLQSSGVIENCYVTGAVGGTGTSLYYVGGIAGYITDSGSTIRNCWASTTVGGTYYVGGIVGYMTTSSRVENCAAFGIAVARMSGSNTQFGRITGYISGSTLIDNVAYANMKFPSGITQTATATGKDGLNVTSAEILADGTLGDRFTTTNGWAVEDGKLPGFGAAVAMPYHLQSEDHADVAFALARITFEANLSARQAEASSAAAAKAKAQEIINALGLDVTTVSVNDGAFTAAVAGTAYAPTDTINGRYDFTVTLTKNGKTLTSPMLTLTIIAPPYNVFSGGDGSSELPFQITTAEELALLASLVNHSDEKIRAAYRSRHYKLMNDLDIGGYDNWTPIGDYSSHYVNNTWYYSIFNGVFDGNGKVISNLKINSTGGYRGLFGYVSGGTVKNLGAKNVSVVSSSNSLGGIAGYVASGGVIENCYVTGEVRSTYSYNDNTGGIAGYITGSGTMIRNCWSSATVSGGYYVGGIVGYTVSNSRVDNCAAVGVTILRIGVNSEPYFGRISGYTSGTLTGNIAYVGMTLPTNVTLSATLTGKDGESRTPEDLQTASGFPTVFTSGATETNPWRYAVGKLPGFTSAGVDMPDHLLPNDDADVAIALEQVLASTASFTTNQAEVSTAAAAKTKAQTIINALNVGVTATVNNDTGATFFTTATIGTSATPLGTNGIYRFTVTLKKGSAERISSVLTLTVTATPYGFSGGDGSSGSPFQITTAAELATLATVVNSSTTTIRELYRGKHYKLMSDLDLSGYDNWTPIGDYSSHYVNNTWYYSIFNGVFDGNGKVIRNLKINSTSSYRGLFGYISGGTIKNLGMEDVSVVSSSQYLGGIAGYMQSGGVIENSYVTGEVNGSSYYIGGIAGYITGSGSTIKNSYVMATVSGTQVVGGIVGQMASSSRVENSAMLGVGVIRTLGSLTSFGRISGSVSSSTLASNVAYADMGVPSGVTLTATANGKDGLNITSVGISADGTIGGRFTTENGWAIEDGKLPGFGSALAMPQHLKSNDDANLAFLAARISVEANFTVPSLEAPSAVAAKAKAQAIIDALNLGVTATVHDDTNAPFFTAAIAGGFPVIAGINGKYNFTVTLSDGVNSITTDVVTLTITTTPYDNSCGVSPETACEINSAADLAALSAIVNNSDATIRTAFRNKHYKLMKDLDLSGYDNWVPIGDYTYNYDYNSSVHYNVFQGVFDGNGKVISNLKISSDNSYLGLFGSINGGTIKNLGVENVSAVSSGQCLGGIVGIMENGGIIDNCYVTGNIKNTNTTSYYSYVGGIAGYTSGTGTTIKNSHTTAMISGTQYVGGISGYVLSGGVIENCNVTGSVSSIGQYVGGIAGYVTSSGVIEKCYVTGDVKGNSSYVGGIAGYVYGSVVENCYVTSEVNGDSYYVGGIAGFITNSSTVRNSWTTASVSGIYYVGGIIGAIGSSSRVEASAALGLGLIRTSGSETVFGRIAYNTYSNSTLTGNIAYANMTLPRGVTLSAWSSGKDGESRTFEELQIASGFPTVFTSGATATNPWHYVEGKLPGFTSVGVDMPEHLSPGDGADVAAAMARVISYLANVTLPQAEASNADAAKTKAQALIDSLKLGVTATVTGNTFTTATAGDVTAPVGENGSYSFTVKLTKGKAERTSEVLTLPIIATPYNFHGGDGLSAETAYEIDTEEELAALATLVNSSATNSVYRNKYYKLMSDLDLSGYENWTPIGDYSSYYVNNTTYYSTFQGVFNGNGKVISNLKITSGGYRGLFGYISGGTVKNFGMENVSVVSSSSYLGGIVGYNTSGIIENCYVTGEVRSTSSSNVGGIAGYITGSSARIRRSWTSMAISGTNYVGGIVGYMVTNSRVDSCAALGVGVIRISGSSTSFGRIAGYNGSTLTGNVAFADMILPPGVTQVATLTGKDGLSRTRDELQFSDAFPTVFTSGRYDLYPWHYRADYLPGFDANCVAMPQHLSSDDYAYASSALTRISSEGNYTTHQAYAPNAATAKIKAQEILDALVEKVGLDVIAVVNDDTNTPAFTAATAGQFATPAGTNGSYRFTVTLTKGAVTLSGETLSLTIRATPFNFFSGGDGLTETTAYQITAAGQLARLAELINNTNNNGATSIAYRDKHYKLMNDLDLDSYANWMPIGNGSGYYVNNTYYYSSFNGVFDGNGKTISNIKVNSTNGNQGLFGNISGGTVKNIGIENVSIVSSSSTLGGIVGSLQGSGAIENCYVTGEVRSTGSSQVGGIVGYVSGNGTSISNCWTSVTVSGTYYVGGIVGYMSSDANVESCAALGLEVIRTSGSEISFGRIVGYNGYTYNSYYEYIYGTLSNNIAYDNMALPDGVVLADTSSGKDGESRTSAALQIAAGFPSVFTSGPTDTNPWHYAMGKLPGFTADGVEMPAHLGAGGDVGVALAWITYGANYTTHQNEVNNAKAANDKVQAIVDAILDELNLGVSAKVSDDTNTPFFTAATTGSPEIPFGTNGSYRFKVTLTKGATALTSDVLTLTIIATPYYFAGGDGLSAETAYQITNAEELAALALVTNNSNTNIRAAYNSKHYKLMNDVDLSDYADWTPIGSSSSSYAFQGVFDGNGKVVSNLKITSGQYRGLFGYISSTTVKNLGMENVNIVSNSGYLGGIVGYNNYGVIENCYVMGEVKGASSYIGGIAGYSNGGTVRNSWTSATVHGTSYAGGIVGYMYNGRVENSAALGIGVIRTSGNNTSFGRVSGYASGTITGNVAYADMALPNGVAQNAAAGGKDGLNRTFGNLQIADGFPSAFTSGASATNPWHYAVGKLPGFTKDGVAMPYHLQSEDHADVMLALLQIMFESKFVTHQVYASSATDAKTVAQNIVDALNLNVMEVTAVVNNDTNTPYFTAATAGTSSNTAGTNGSYRFTVTLTKGAVEFTSEVIALTIRATPHNFFSGGDGLTEKTAYQITTAAQLEQLATQINNNAATNAAYGDKYYILMNNLNLNAYANWNPIGSSSYMFQGAFDGNGKVISNLKINSASGSGRGLFGYIRGGVVKNLGLEGARVVSSGSNINYLGGIVSYLQGGGVIENCYVTGEVSGAGVGTSSYYIGGIAGYITGSGSAIRNSWTSVTVSGTGYVGGIVGYMESNASVENCASLGSDVTRTSGNGTSFGRISGYTYSSALANNIAFDGMTLPNDVTLNIASTGKDGMNRTSYGLQISAGYLSVFTSGPTETNPWHYAVGKLPGFMSAGVDMPDHLLPENQNPDYKEAALALALISYGTDFKASLAEASTSAAAKTKVESIIGALSLSVTSTVNNDAVSPFFTAAIAGIDKTPLGTNGSYRFTATVTKGAVALTSEVLTLNIIATPYNFSGGDGLTPNTAYQITSGKQLTDFATFVNDTLSTAISMAYRDKHYKLMNDLNLGTYPDWTPIGNSTTNSFQGVFDGNGKVISNLKIASEISARGLFGYVSGGMIKNLGMKDVSVVSNGTYLGGIAGYLQEMNNRGAIENCYVTGDVRSTGSSIVGGIVGYVYGRNAVVKNCWSTATVSGTRNVGGIVGQMLNDSRVESCIALGSDVEREGAGTSTTFGRVVGYNGGTLTNNMAFAGMAIPSGVTLSAASDGKDGQSRTLRELQIASGFPTVFTSGATVTNPWHYVIGKLPGFTPDGVEIPDYLKLIVINGQITFENGSTTYTGQEHTYETAKTKAGFVSSGTLDWVYEYAVCDENPTGNEKLGVNKKPVSVGNYKVTVNYYDDRYFGTETVTFVVKKATGAGTVAVADWTYGKTASTPVTTSGTGTVSYAYKVSGANDATYSATVPNKVGNYTVRAVFAESANYLSHTDTANFVISKAIVTITGLSSSNKEYDGNTTAMVTGTAVVSGKVGNDVVTVSNGTASFNNKNVGTGKAVSFTGFSLSGADAGNYTLSAQPASVTANITAKPVTITGLSSSNKEYDGNTTATVTGTAVVSGKVGNDVVTVSNGTAAFNNKNVGTGKAVTFTGFSLSGADAGNYTLSAQPASVTANITAKPVTITGLSSSNKEYDGNTTATVAGTAAVSGKVGNDVVTVSNGTAAFNNKNVGTGKAVTFTGFTLGGADAGNYTLSAQPANVTANITAKPVTVTATVNGKVYDGNATATVASSSVSGTVSGDVVTVNNGTASFNNKNVGTGKTVTFTGFTLSGADAGNYSLSVQPASVTANIVPKPITITGVTAVDRSYVLGDKTVVLNGGELVGIETGDAVTFTLGSGTMTNDVVGTNKPVTVNISLVGDAAGNYTLTQPTNITVSIGTSAVLSGDRNITDTDVGSDATVIAPIGSASFEIVAGPNPAQKSDGVMKIFASGKSIVSGTLAIYDATGNVVRKININDNGGVANVATGSRTIAEWDLRDANGRAVAAGTYILRGLVKTADGKRERVSVIVGVR